MPEPRSWLFEGDSNVTCDLLPLASLRKLVTQLEIRDVSSVPRSAWDGYVCAHDQGSIFHTEAFCRIYEVTPCHEPYFVCAVNASGKIVALLSAVRVALGETMSRWTSRSLMYAEPICDATPEGRHGLEVLLKVHDQFMARRVLFSEIRPNRSCNCLRQLFEGAGYEHHDYFNYLQDLTEGEAALSSRAKKTLQKVRASKRKGAECLQVDGTEESLARIYRVVAESYQRAQVPLSPIQLFDATRRFMEEGSLELRLLYYQGRDVAAAIGLTYKDRYYAWYNGTTRPGDLPATAAVLVWDEMQNAFARGLKTYDFGGAGWPNESYGPRVFKSRFKGRLTNFGRYRKVNSRLKLKVAQAGYHLLRASISRNGAQSPGATSTSKTFGGK